MPCRKGRHLFSDAIIPSDHFEPYFVVSKCQRDDCGQVLYKCPLCEFSCDPNSDRYKQRSTKVWMKKHFEDHHTYDELLPGSNENDEYMSKYNGLSDCESSSTSDSSMSEQNGKNIDMDSLGDISMDYIADGVVDDGHDNVIIEDISNIGSHMGENYENRLDVDSAFGSWDRDSDLPSVASTGDSGASFDSSDEKENGVTDDDSVKSVNEFCKSGESLYQYTMDCVED